MNELAPILPAGGYVDLPGRGRAWVWDTGGPAGAPAVVLLHGWTSTAALNWFRCFEPLAQRYRVIAPDHRGHGRGIRSRRPFRLEDCADDVAALIADLELPPVIVVGYSMGGPIAQLLWRRHPESVAGLVLCATATRFASRRSTSGPLGVASLGLTLAVSSVPGPLRRQGLAQLVQRRGSDGRIAAWATEEWQRSDPAALLQAGLALGRFDSSAWIGSIDVPTSVVVTTRDQTVSPELQWALAGGIPGAEAFPVLGSHRACAESAREFVPALIDACAFAGGTSRPEPASAV
ncbi:MAG: alpha/beta fold hydrolase [Acidimicrobiales bacterium]